MAESFLALVIGFAFLGEHLKLLFRLLVILVLVKDIGTRTSAVAPGKSCESTCHAHYTSTCVVNEAHFLEPASTPDPRRWYRIYDAAHEEAESNVGGNGESFLSAPQDNYRRSDSVAELKNESQQAVRIHSKAKEGAISDDTSVGMVRNSEAHHVESYDADKCSQDVRQ